MLSTVAIQNELLHSESYKDCFEELTYEEIARLTDGLLETLDVFDKICRKHHLKYMLVAGALIGAVRDGKCIPWDDDIDLVMPRQDYNRLGDILKKINSRKFIISYPENSSVITMAAHFYNKKYRIRDLINRDVGDSKIYESFLYLDILPLDNCPDNTIINMIRGSLVDLIQVGYISRRCFKRNDEFLCFLAQDSLPLKFNMFLRKIIALPFLIIPPKLIFRLLELLLKNSSNSKNVTIAFGAKHYFGELTPRDYWYPVKDLQLNGLQIMGPNKPEEYLNHRYGDYLKIPLDSEKRERMLRLKSNWKNCVKSR